MSADCWGFAFSLAKNITILAIIHEVTGIKDFQHILLCLHCQWWSNCWCFTSAEQCTRVLILFLSKSVWNVQKTGQTFKKSRTKEGRIKKFESMTRRKSQCQFTDQRAFFESIVDASHQVSHTDCFQGLRRQCVCDLRFMQSL